MEMPLLLQFTFSHYNEKARWALDFKRVPHVRRSLIPGPHSRVVTWSAIDSASRTSPPRRCCRRWLYRQNFLICHG